MRASHHLRTTSAVVGLLLVASALLGTSSTPAQSAVEPTVSVSPSTRLHGGDTVRVRATGLPPGVSVNVVQCDDFENPEAQCPPAQTVTTTASGTLSLDLRLADPVFKTRPFGDSAPVYCRDDVCRVGITQVDDEGAPVLLAQSTALRFRGSTATVAVRPSTDLRARQWVKVTGTAYGARGRWVKVAESDCFDIVQATGCTGTLPARWTRVRDGGTFAVAYLARSVLADGQHCTVPDELIGSCVVTATVYGRDGQPDLSFGVPAFADPSAGLTFRE